jgi:beta-glucanase (GH16 family)
MLLIGLLGAAVLLAPTASAAKSGSGCKARGKAPKAAEGKGGKKKRKTRGACRPAAAAAIITGPSSAGSSSTELRDGCGPPLAKSTGGYWRCSFHDNFSGNSLDRSKWLPQLTDSSGFSNSMTACFVDDPDNISVSSGSLKLIARKEASSFTCKDPAAFLGSFQTQYTSGMVSTWGRFSQAYGRFEIRARVPSTPIKGLQSALWLWPAGNGIYGSWPASGEIDIAEMYSSFPDRAIPYIHYNAAGHDPNVTNTNCLIPNLGEFHTYAAEWTPSSITITYDGVTCLVDHWNPAAPLVAPQPFDQPFIVALTQELGIGGNAFNPQTTPLPATTEVDYVRVWS